MKKKVENQENKPAWLTDLQQKSWEPEVLLSGIVLYGMFQIPDLLDEFLYFFKANFTAQNTDVDNFITMMKIAVYWLTAGLIAHLVSRGIWVGMVGLSFTFPKGIESEKLKLAPKFKGFISQIPETHKIILNLENISSALFSISFMLFMMMTGAYFYLLVTIIIPVFTIVSFFPSYFESELAGRITAIVVVTILIMGLVGLIDFLTLGFFKRFKWLSRFYWPIYRFVGTLTLARFYRPIYYILITNIKGWKIALLLLFFVVSSFWGLSSANNRYPGESFSRISLWSDSQSTSAFTGYYDDQIEDVRSVVASIQSDIIRGNTIRLFVVMQAHLEDSIIKRCNLDSLLEIKELSSPEARLQCISEFYSISIDDSLITTPPLKFHFKTKTKQKGMLAFIDVTNLTSGLHHLTLEVPKEMYRNNNRLATIPFYREVTYEPFFIPAYESEEQEKDSYMKLKPILPK